MFANLINWLSRPSSRAVGLILSVGFVAGAIFFIVFHFTMNATNSMSICISCHEMDGVYAEYKESKHYLSKSGVRASCADCHVPHGKTFPDWIDKFLAKLEIGSKDIYHHFIGTYPDKPAFEKARWHLAQNVLENMKKRDSKECRACHSLEAMLLSEQDKSGAKKHKSAMEKGDKTCIDCHTGIAHKMPEEPETATKNEK
ncbi:MAG: NapC/NirT family cytochrome c [Magnetococcales bacterium]|nr:NapC/NirT family cytochrome c [Magnetococcales bacterium]MBF0439664.1 NapC/NirT family cytochrome c [Magnetococcales bacterium]